MNQCRCCGTLNPEDYQYCMSCGAPVNSENSTTKESTNNQPVLTAEQNSETKAYSASVSSKSEDDPVSFDEKDLIDTSDSLEKTGENDDSHLTFEKWFTGALLIGACAFVAILGAEALTETVAEGKGMSLTLLSLPVLVAAFATCLGRFKVVTLSGLLKTLGLFLLPVINLIYAPSFAGNGIKFLFWSSRKLRKNLALGEEKNEQDNGFQKILLWLFGFAIISIIYFTGAYLLLITHSSQSVFMAFITVIYLIALSILQLYLSALGFRRPASITEVFIILFLGIIPIYGTIVVPYYCGRGAYRVIKHQELSSENSICTENTED